jgi:hypothetical protein
MSEKSIVWFGMKVSPEQKRKIERLARQKGLTQKDAVLAAVDSALRAERPQIDLQEGSFLDRYGKYCGAVNGPGDLNVNKAHYMLGYGRPRDEDA